MARAADDRLGDTCFPSAVEWGHGPSGAGRCVVKRLPLTSAVLAMALTAATVSCTSAHSSRSERSTTTTRLAQGCSSTGPPAATGQLNITVSCHARVEGGPRATAQLTDVAFPDAAHGWLAGQSCAAGQVPPSCPGVIQYHGAAAVGGMDFVDDLHGFAVEGNQCDGIGAICGQLLLATADGGDR